MKPPRIDPPTTFGHFIYHLLAQDDWDRARAAGTYAPAGLKAEGFIHCSTFAQLAAVAEGYFAGRGDILILRIDPVRLSAPVRYEPSEPGQLFPHLYGALELEAVVESRRLTFDSAGHAQLPDPWSLAADLSGPRGIGKASVKEEDHGSSPEMD